MGCHQTQQIDKTPKSIPGVKTTETTICKLIYNTSFSLTHSLLIEKLFSDH